MTPAEIANLRALCEVETPTIGERQFRANALALRVPALLDEVERLRALVAEACDLGELLAGLECDSVAECKITAIRAAAGGAK